MNLQLKESKANNLPDFVALKQRYDHLDSGPRADLRKVAHFEDVADLPAYYRWLGGVPDKPGLQRIAFLLPHVGHNGSALPLGQQFRKRRISEIRLFQVLRSELPSDLEYLRRLLIHADLSLDWQVFGQTLYFWGATSKRRILQDYFTPVHTDTNPA
ncbi:MAG: type I-E CRISPR-associated protein Cse2/CasB [Gammaproteobacteria bacterium]|nr:type I-E CRISPR-associated protein Cse2/CasB [Gammaproteobacteria bacterium]MBU1962878.1 type I-E CRISPR-associated protein Cse2/CasB [Gammaproteobacteria bacterium]